MVRTLMAVPVLKTVEWDGKVSGMETKKRGCEDQPLCVTITSVTNVHPYRSIVGRSFSSSKYVLFASSSLSLSILSSSLV